MTSVENQKILVLGATGMLGHKMFQVLSSRYGNVYGTMRGSKIDARWNNVPILASEKMLDGLDAMEIESFLGAVREVRPDVLVNCIGAIKQRPSAEDPVVSITLNSLLPHRLAAEVAKWGGRLVHFSTDCVFSGNTGGYVESDQSDAQDLYGKSKHMGELLRSNGLVLRTSIIGRELDHHVSLLDWFLLGGHETVRGFTRAWWSGVTTLHLSELVAEIIGKFGYLNGLYQVSSGKISKHELLLLLNEVYGLSVQVIPDESFHCDRSLNGESLTQAIGYKNPGWQAMLDAMLRDVTPYKQPRKQAKSPC